MKYLKYLVIFATLMFVASCTESDIVKKPTSHNNQIQVVGRVVPFTDRNVSSRAVKVGDETNIVRLSLAIFNTEKECVNLIHTDGNNTIFKIDQTNLQNGFDLYIFANIQFDEDLTAGASLDDFLTHPIAVSGIDMPTINGVKCFPMMGKLENYNSQTYAGSIIEIPLTALYSKIMMNIEVRPDQDVAENKPARFILNGYAVHHVARSVDFIGKDKDDEGQDTATSDTTLVLDDTFEGSIESNNVAQGANNVQFSFYLPERFLQPNTSATDYNYPFKKDDGSIREEDEKHRQRFKPCLVEENDPPATFVRFFGEYIDHQDHHYNVSYDIYVGNDNYSNFDIERNTQYNNYITIRGIQTSNDMSDNEDAISIDHRVDIERSQPAIISLRRETLLDSHFEVRPLRVRKVDVGDVGNINAVKVEVVNPTVTYWMRLERSAGKGTAYENKNNENGESIYITDEGASKGKRKYFTYNLVNGVTPGNWDYPLNNSTEVILPLSDNTECCWIYVDENMGIGDGVRSGKIKVSYGNQATDGIFTATTDTDFPPVEYYINQRKLFQVTGTNTYNIEYHEEYLHNYDADDEYGQTEYEGMQWGLDGIQLSYDDRSSFISESGGFLSWLLGLFGSSMTDFINNYLDDISAKYDFYIERDKSENPSAIVHNYSGYTFCNEIIQEVNGASGNDTDDNNNIDVLQLNQQPRSAIEYCYNKNKRNNKGHVVWQNTDGTYNQSQLNWYLPAIDEIEDIVMSKYGNENSYSRFLEFQDKFYWSSQPAYDKYGIYIHTRISDSKGDGTYFEDDIDRARATKVTVKDGEYKNEASGVTGVLGTNSYEVETYIFYTRVHQEGFTPSNATITYDNGNKPRTSMARVRCVRKGE